MRTKYTHTHTLMYHVYTYIYILYVRIYMYDIHICTKRDIRVMILITGTPSPFWVVRFQEAGGRQPHETPSTNANSLSKWLVPPATSSRHFFLPPLWIELPKKEPSPQGGGLLRSIQSYRLVIWKIHKHSHSYTTYRHIYIFIVDSFIHIWHTYTYTEREVLLL